MNYRRTYDRIAELEQELAQCLDCCKRVGELEDENERLRDALKYAMSYMDDEQQNYLMTDLWPELFKENNDD